MTSKNIVQFLDRNDLKALLEANTGIILIKLGASWCGPCKKIDPELHKRFLSFPDNIICCDLDVDDNFDIYAFLKSKQVVNGIPVLLAYAKGNTNPITPDITVTGADPQKLGNFFASLGLIYKKINS